MIVVPLAVGDGAVRLPGKSVYQCGMAVNAMVLSLKSTCWLIGSQMMVMMMMMISSYVYL